MKFYLKLFLFLLTTVPAFSITYEVGFDENSKDPVFFQLSDVTSYLCYIKDSQLLIEQRVDDKFVLTKHPLKDSIEIISIDHFNFDGYEHLLVKSKTVTGYKLEILKFAFDSIEKVDWLIDGINSGFDFTNLSFIQVDFDHMILSYQIDDTFTFLIKNRESLSFVPLDFIVNEMDYAFNYYDNEVFFKGTFLDVDNNLYVFEIINGELQTSIIDQLFDNNSLKLDCGFSFEGNNFLVFTESSNNFTKYICSDSNIEKKHIDLSFIGNDWYFKDFETLEIGQLELIDNNLIFNGEIQKTGIKHFEIFNNSLIQVTNDNDFSVIDLISGDQLISLDNYISHKVEDNFFIITYSENDSIIVDLFDSFKMDKSKTIATFKSDNIDIDSFVNNIKINKNLINRFVYTSFNDLFFYFNNNSTLSLGTLEVIYE